MSLFTPTILVHVAAALLALGIGAAVFLGRKGTRTHRWLGRSWAVLMLAVAISSFWITGPEGRYSWIHGLSVFVTLAVPFGVYLAITGRVNAHRRMMTNVYVGALIVAGLFALAPNRLLGRLVWDALGLH